MLAFILKFLAASALVATISHTDKGTEYGENAVIAYTESNHGPDGSIFLDPYFKPAIENLDNKQVLDAGCGAAPWSIYAAKHGGKVYAIDIQEGMIRAAEKAIKTAKLIDRISLHKGDVARLPYKEAFFDRAISICVGCNLPIISFENHVREFQRVLKKDGVAVVGAPTSLDVVFSNGSKTEAEVFLHIQKVLQQLPENPSSEEIVSKLLQLDEVLSATFHYKGGRIALVANEKDLKEGEKIWRKLPKLVVPNNYYSAEFYIKMFKKYNFEIQKIDMPHFKNEDERVAHNASVPSSAQLGQAYVIHSPFIIFHIKKSEEPLASKKDLENIVKKTSPISAALTN